MTRPTLSATLGPLRVGQTRPFGPPGHTSAIDKQAVVGPIYLDRLGLAGDQQADRRVHGGPDKALHYFPAEHYATLAAHWPTLNWGVGAFGENLSGHGLGEADVCVGDIFSLGACQVQLSQGRQPCWKLNVRFGQPGMARWVEQSGCTGWYFRVLMPGWLQGGETLRLLERPQPQANLALLMQALRGAPLAGEVLAQLAALPELPVRWQQRLQARLAGAAPQDARARWQTPSDGDAQ